MLSLNEERLLGTFGSSSNPKAEILTRSRHNRGESDASAPVYCLYMLFMTSFKFTLPNLSRVKLASISSHTEMKWDVLKALKGQKRKGCKIQRKNLQDKRSGTRV